MVIWEFGNGFSYLFEKISPIARKYGSIPQFITSLVKQKVGKVAPNLPTLVILGENGRLIPLLFMLH